MDIIKHVTVTYVEYNTRRIYHNSFETWCLFFVFLCAVFKYEKGLDSVLVVNQEAYDNCNKTNPKETLSDGESVFKFKRSGPFFFISGQNDKCEKGEKLIIVVMAVRHHISTKNTTTSAPPTQAPVMAPSTTVLQGDGPKVYTPVVAPVMAISGVESTGYGSSIGLIFGLGLSLVLKGF